MATIEEVLEEVTAQSTRLDSIDALLDGLQTQIQELIAGQGNVPPALQAKIDEVFNVARQNTQKIDAAIDEHPPTPV